MDWITIGGTCLPTSDRIIYSSGYVQPTGIMMSGMWTPPCSGFDIDSWTPQAVVNKNIIIVEGKRIEFDKCTWCGTRFRLTEHSFYCPKCGGPLA